MFNLDITKILPQHMLNPLLAIVPGLFFETSIMLGAPSLVENHAGGLLLLTPLTRYPLILLIAFVVGTALMQTVRTIQIALTRVHGLRLILADEFNRLVRIPIANRLAAKPGAMLRPYVQSFHKAAYDRLAERTETRLIGRVWNKLAAKLLKERYGIVLTNQNLETGEWQYLFWSIGEQTDADLRGSLLMIASEATGWAALTAATLAPDLRNPYYLGLCAILLLTGLHNDWYVAGRRRDPTVSAMLQLRALLREYEKGWTPHREKEKPTTDSAPSEPEPE